MSGTKQVLIVIGVFGGIFAIGSLQPEPATIIVFLGLLTLYFLPWIIANIRHHPQELAIFMLTLLLGWTLIGWAGAMVWAFVAQPHADAHSR